MSTASPRAAEARELPHPTLAGMPAAEVLALIRSPNVGAVTFFHLLRRFGSAGEALHHLPELAKRGGGKIIPRTRTDGERELEAAKKFGARMVMYGEADYPERLLHIPDPPPVLTVLGNTDAWKTRRCIAIVGARNASANGCQFAQKLAAELAASGATVVSGLARGIDTFAHRGALSGGTAAVIAGGIDTIYPPENKELYRQIAERGAILSEQAFGQAPHAGSFPSRNRIISGMSEGVAVVEASPKSGSLITARLAGEQGREVFAVPGSPLDPRARGTNGLIKQGAILLEEAADIWQALAQPSLSLRETGRNFMAPLLEPSGDMLRDAQARVLEKCGITPVSLEVLMAQCSLSESLLFTALMELELAGRIRRVPGGGVCLAVS